MMLSANTDPELREWLRWAFEGGKVPVFVRTVAEAALIACLPDYALLRPVLLELKRQRPSQAAALIQVSVPVSGFSRF